MIVLDTSALVFWTLDREHLSARALSAIESDPEKLVSAISIWEIGLKVKKGGLELPLPISDYAARLETVEGLRIEAVGVQTWLKNLELEWSHRDPADRTVVATAMLHDSPLVTSDATIRSFYDRSVW